MTKQKAVTAKRKIIPIVKAKVYFFSAWSFSRYQDYVRCPAYAKYKHLMKLKTAPNDAMARGTDIHTKAEHFLDGRLKTLPPELVKLRADYAKLRKLGLRGELVQEQMWGHDREWRPCDPKAWDICWLRVKTDVAYLEDKGRVLCVDDHKTGRIKEDSHREQLSLYGVSSLHRYAKVQEVHGRMLYTDHGKKIEAIIKRTQLVDQTTQWEHKVAFMFADRRFAPKPNNTCRWCDFSKAKGGPCQY